MKKFIPVIALTFLPLVCSADLLNALHSYKEGAYTEALTEFQQLSKLGQPEAAFNLGVMALKGQGQAENKGLALTYFKLADYLGHPKAASTLALFEVTEQEMQQAQTRADTLLAQTPSAITSVEPSERRKVIKRVAPQYPANAVQKGRQAHLRLKYLVNEEGKVTYVQTLYGYPEGVFDKAAEHAIKKWQFAPAQTKSVETITLGFAIGLEEPARHNAWFKKLHATMLNLWPSAEQGHADSQYNLSLALEFLSRDTVFYYQESEVAGAPSLEHYNAQKGFAFKDIYFDGMSTISVDSLKQVTFSDGTEFATDELKAHLATLDVGAYKIRPFNENYGTTKAAVIAQNKMWVQPLTLAPTTWDPEYWLQQAAKNGHEEAQRKLAATHLNWSKALTDQNDTTHLVWAALRAITENNQEQAKAYMSQAQKQGYTLAKELEPLFI